MNVPFCPTALVFPPRAQSCVASSLDKKFETTPPPPPSIPPPAALHPPYASTLPSGPSPSTPPPVVLLPPYVLPLSSGPPLSACRTMLPAEDDLPLATRSRRPPLRWHTGGHYHRATPLQSWMEPPLASIHTTPQLTGSPAPARAPPCRRPLAATSELHLAGQPHQLPLPATLAVVEVIF
jgi:hypothetical protein